MPLSACIAGIEMSAPQWCLCLLCGKFLKKSACSFFYYFYLFYISSSFWNVLVEVKYLPGFSKQEKSLKAMVRILAMETESETRRGSCVRTNGVEFN